ncbi:MAG TPA: hypothetical protein PLU17_07120 [Chitinophagaceae bacterium]|jgi:hypothetical protein|nr:hypothetical protein [Chitinophagaceae bacterium]
MTKYFFILIVLFFSAAMNAQVTHSLGITAGISNVFYKSDIKGNKNFVSIFSPTISAEYSKHNDNVFWGGAGFGFTLRQVPFYVFPTGQKAGMNIAEIWLRARAGLKIERSFTTHLPYLSLGFAHHADRESFIKDGNSSFTYLNNLDSNYTATNFHPFIEIGNKIINSTFRDEKRNVSFTFALRYYPVALFKSPIQFEYDFQQFKTVQYHIIEFSIIAGLQRNFHK